MMSLRPNWAAQCVPSIPKSMDEPRILLVACLLQSHLAAEHAVDKEKVAKHENHTQAPPNQSDAQSMMTGSRVVDG